MAGIPNQTVKGGRQAADAGMAGKLGGMSPHFSSRPEPAPATPSGSGTRGRTAAAAGMAGKLSGSSPHYQGGPGTNGQGV